jgi:hypothetical protein
VFGAHVAIMSVFAGLHKIHRYQRGTRYFDRKLAIELLSFAAFIGIRGGL